MNFPVTIILIQNNRHCMNFVHGAVVFKVAFLQRIKNKLKCCVKVQMESVNDSVKIEFM
jgi:hypothetical protein